MVLDDIYEYERETLITQGQHDFVLNDLNIQITNKDGEEIHYLRFELQEKPTNEIYGNLLSCPMNNKTKSFAENSKFSKLLDKFGIQISEKEKVTAKMLNDLIGTEFNALVIYDGQFAKIDTKSITID